MIDLEKIKPITGDKRRSRFLTLFYTHLSLLIFSTIMRLVFFFLFQDTEAHLHTVLKSFALGFLFDLRAVALVLLPSTIMIFLPITLTSNHFFARVIKTIQFITIFIYQLLFAVDIGNYQYLKWRLNSSILDVLDNTHISFSMVQQTYPIFSGLCSLLVLSTIFFLIIEWIKKKYYYTGKYGLIYFPYRLERFFWFILIIPLLYGKISYFPLRWSDAFFTTNSFNNQLALNPLMNFLESLDKKNQTYNLELVKKYYPVMSDFLGVVEKDNNNLNFKRNFNFEATSDAKPHIIFIQMESMAYDKSSMSDNPLDPTPFLKKMALEEGMYFSKFFTPTEATARGVFATLTGIADVTYDKSSSRNPLTSDHDLIFNQLSDYKKYYFLGGSANWGNIRGLWTSNIKDVQIFEEGSWQSPRIDVWGISDLNLFKESLKIISQSTQPMLSYIQTAGFHRPYTIPDDRENFEIRKDVSIEEVKKHGFLSLEEYNSIRFQDFSLGRFWEYLKKTPIYPNVIVAIYGDHGLPSDKSLHVPKGHYLHRVVNHHVPLVILAPNRQAPMVNSEVIGSMVDIVPTVMSIAKIPFYTKTLGRNLLGPRTEQNNAAFLFSFQEKPKHVSMIDAKFLWVDRPTQKGLYLYESEDPLTDVSAQYPEVVERYRNLADGFFETSKYMLYNNKKASTR